MAGTFGSYATSLLKSVAAYRAKWDRPDRVLRNRGVNHAAIARTIAEHVASTGGPARSLSAWKTLVWRALTDRSCSAQFLDLLIEVFAIDENPMHEHQLRSLHAVTFTGRVVLPLSLDWVPEQVLAQMGGRRKYRTLGVHDRHVVGPDGSHISHRSLHVIEAVSPGATASTSISMLKASVSKCPWVGP